MDKETTMFCVHCGCEYSWVNPDDPGDCWNCQKPLEVQAEPPVTTDADNAAALK
jgi:hypothetical protein